MDEGKGCMGMTNERLGVSVPQVRALIRAGEIQAINAGSGDERRAVRVSVQSVEAFERRRAM